MKIAIIGATGLVGREIQRIIESMPGSQTRDWDIILAASDESAKANPRHLTTVQKAHEERPDFAFFAAGDPVSRQWTYLFQATGSTVIDKSGIYRGEAGVPLVVVGLNESCLYPGSKLICTPNCAATQLALAVSPMNELYGIESMWVTSMQSVSGAGKAAMEQFRKERVGSRNYKRELPGSRIFDNLVPVCGEPMGVEWLPLTSEERKIRSETRRLLGSDLDIHVCCYRVSVERGHTQDIFVNVRPGQKSFDIGPLLEAYRLNEHIVMALGNPSLGPADISGSDKVYITRIYNQGSTVHLTVLCDNLRKGAALNAVQIMEHMMHIRNA